MEFDPQSLRERLLKLSKSSHQRKVLGGAVHDYNLNPPISVGAIESFEAEHNIALPSDYKQFFTEVGNGGAGPGYGLFPFGQHDDSTGLCTWQESDLVGDFGKPFPHTETWNLSNEFWDKAPDPPQGISEEDENKLWEKWDKILDAEYWNPEIMNGAIPLCHLGCAHRQWLVVHGNQRGFIWDDMRADDGGLSPVKDANGKQMTFADWYLAWLAEAEQNQTAPTFDPVPRSSRDLLTLLLLVVVSVVVGLLFAIFRNLP